MEQEARIQLRDVSTLLGVSFVQAWRLMQRGRLRRVGRKRPAMVRLDDVLVYKTKRVQRAMRVGA